MYDKPAMTYFKYQVYLFSSEAIRQPPPPPPMYGSISFTHLEREL
jgi:hypothetical protein